MSENNRPDSEQKKDQTTAEDILAQVDSILADLENSAVAQLFAAPEKPKPEENKNRLKKKNQRRPASLSRRTRMRSSRKLNRKPIHRTKVKANLRRRKRRPEEAAAAEPAKPSEESDAAEESPEDSEDEFDEEEDRRMRLKTRTTGTNRN